MANNCPNVSCVIWAGRMLTLGGFNQLSEPQASHMISNYNYNFTDADAYYTTGENASRVAYVLPTNSNDRLEAKYNVTTSPTTILGSNDSIWSKELDGGFDSAGVIVLSEVGYGYNVDLEFSFNNSGSKTCYYGLTNVDETGEGRFSGCTDLTSTELLPSMITISNYTYSGCSSLTDYGESSWIWEIGTGAFADCTSLSNASIGMHVYSIGAGAFSGCTSISTIDFYGLDSVSNYISEGNDFAVIKVKGLKWTNNSLTTDTCQYNSIPDECFKGCTNLESVNFIRYSYSCSNGVSTAPTSIGYLCFPENITSIGYGAFSGCAAIRTLEITSAITSIGNDAFSSCDYLTNLYYDAQCGVDNNMGFRSNYGIEKVVIGDTTPSIGYQSFQNCIYLSSVTIGTGVETIGNSAFNYCTSLTDIDIPNNVRLIGQNAFYNCSSLSSVTYNAQCSVSGSMGFSGSTALTTVYIDNSTPSIGDSAFQDCYGLTSVTIGSNVTSIGDSAFENCNGLTSIDIPNGVTSIGENAFYYCDSLTSIDIPDSVTSIGDGAFLGCTSAESVFIGTGVTSIEDNAFTDCGGLTGITITATTPPDLGSTANAFNNTNDCPIYVPSGSVDTYKTTSGWRNYASRIFGS